MWPFKPKAPPAPPPSPPCEPSPLERWAHEIAEAEFLGFAARCDMLYGIYDVTATLRTEGGIWLAGFVQDRQTALMYRVRREVK